MNDRIYLDHAATTPVSPEVLEAMMPFYTENFGNASSIHGTGREARKAVEAARRQTAKAIGALPEEIYFTSGGTESDNWAVAGIGLAHPGKHMITTAVEHHAVLHCCAWLEKLGMRVTYLRPDREGRIETRAVRDAICEDTVLISVMTANNEVGTLQPVEEIGALAREKGIPFHTDAVQAVGSIPVDVERMHADLLSLSAHKFQGPKGVGALYIRKGISLPPLLHGGAQERGRRAGTENLPAIVGLGKAISLAVSGMDEHAGRVRSLRDRLIRGLLEIPGAVLNGPETGRLPNNCNVSFQGVESEALLLRLDLEGIAVSGGSACTSGSLDPSHVLMAMGKTREEAQGSIRLTPGPENTPGEMDETVEAVRRIVADIRAAG